MKEIEKKIMELIEEAYLTGKRGLEGDRVDNLDLQKLLNMIKLKIK